MIASDLILYSTVENKINNFLYAFYKICREHTSNFKFNYTIPAKIWRHFNLCDNKLNV